MSTRITDPDAIERRLLDLAFTTTAELTPSALAYFAPCSIADASSLLDDLAARGRIQLDVLDDGTLRYTLPGRTLAAPPMPVAIAPARPAALAFTAPPASPALAAVLTALVPGAGHAYARRWGAAIAWFVLVSVAYALILPGLVLHVACMISAARSARRTHAVVGPTPFALAAWQASKLAA